MDLSFTPQFRRQFKKLAPALQEEALEKIELFKESNSNPSLHVHKLHGRLSDHWSFSVNYRFRIVFTWETLNKSAICIAIGDHSIHD